MNLYAIWSERNNAVRECNMAVAEKRQAMADRDRAILQRDAAFVDRDNARMQRDNAIAQLQQKKNLMNASISGGVIHNPSESNVRMQRDDAVAQLQMKDCSMNASSIVIYNPSESGVIYNPSESGVSVSQVVKEMQVVQKQQQRRQHIVNYSEIAFKPVEVPFSDVFGQSTTSASKSLKAKKGKHAKETKAVSYSKALKSTRETKTVSPNKASKRVRETKTALSTKALKPARKISKRGTTLSNKQIIVASHPSSDNGSNGKSVNLEKQLVVKGGLSLDELGLDYANLPVPFCSCTGNPQSCYKWGKGGWQSACCTTMLSMYPLPQMPNKRHSRMGGRKMSGGAFTKLITRLASEGHNINAPIDLKNHWARHGTNRYIIIR